MEEKNLPKFKTENFKDYTLKDILNKKPKLYNQSIFDSSLTKELKMNEIILDFSNSKQKENTILERCIGAIYGMAVADAYGHWLEFTPQSDKTHKEKAIELTKDGFVKCGEIFNRFDLEPGQWTDDTSMGLCIADSLLIQNKADYVDMRKRFTMWWECGYNNAFRYDDQRQSKHSVGLGQCISWSLEEFEKNVNDTIIDQSFTTAGNKNSNGIGSIMRLSPVPIQYHNNMELALKVSANSALTTHMGDESQDCCKLMSFIMIKAFYQDTKQDSENKSFAKDFLDNLNINEIISELKTESIKLLAASKKEKIEQFDKFNKLENDRDWNWKNPNFRYSETRVKIDPGYVGGYATDALAMALHCVYHTTNFNDCILQTINLRGDADSVGSVAGQIAGSLYGISELNKQALETVLKWDNNGEIGLRALYLYSNNI